MDRKDVAVYERVIGVDVAKSAHHHCTVDPSGDVVSRGEMRSDERSVAEALASAASGLRALVVVDQHRTFGAPLVRCAQACGMDVACVSPRDFARASELWGEDKTDALDAAVLARIPLAVPGIAHLLPLPDEALEALREVSSVREGCVCERTRAYNRLHDLVCRMCPAWEQVLARNRLHTRQALTILSRYGCPSALRRSGERARAWVARQPGCGAGASELAGRLLRAAREQEAPVAAEDVLGRRASSLARRLLELEAECSLLEEEIEAVGQGVRDYAILRSVPGFGVAASAAAAGAIGDISRFGSPAKLATYSGLSARNHESGTSVRGTRGRKGGNRVLKAAFFRSAAMAAMTHAPSAAYYGKKRAEGKSHVQAVRALARRRVDVVFALLSKGEMFDQARHA